MKSAKYKIINLLKTFFFAHQFSLVFVYLMCGPRQLFFFQCGPETPKGWTCLCLGTPNCYGKNKGRNDNYELGSGRETESSYRQDLDLLENLDEAQRRE